MIAKNGRLAIVCFGFFTTLLICGCGALPHAERKETPVQQGVTGPAAQTDVLRVSAERYRLLAFAYEKDQQPYKAAFMWRVVQKFAPDDHQAGHKIKELEQQIRSEADKHYSKGMDYTKRNSYLSARNEFLTTLAYDPNQKGALESLRYESEAPGYTMYETKQGDTMPKVAQKVYLDPGKAFIVAYFSELSNDANLKPGMLLKLPVIESESEPKTKRIPLPGLRRVQRVYNKAGAEDHYRKGVSFFLAEDMQRAIREWEETLSLDPEHPNARRNIEKARNLMRKGRLK